MNKVISSVAVKNSQGREVIVPVNFCQPVNPSFLENFFDSGPRIKFTGSEQEVEFTGSKQTKQLKLMTSEYYEKTLNLKVGKKYKVSRFNYLE